jgi:hypothetical protein
MGQWLRKKIISMMGNVYVWLDRGLKHPKGNILGYEIDADFEAMGRQELCNHIDDRFGLPHDAFWELESTQKIRLGTQLARNLKKNYTIKHTTKGNQEIEEVVNDFSPKEEE